MEGNGKEECCIWNGIEDIGEKQVDVKFVTGSVESNDTSRPTSDIFEDSSFRLYEMPVSVETAAKRMSFSEIDRVEELTNQMRNHYVESNVKDTAEIVMKDVAGREKLDQACPSPTTSNGNVTRTIESNHIEIISVRNEDNITLKKDCGNGEPVYDSVNPKIECTSPLLKTNNHFIITGSSNHTKKIQDNIIEIAAQEINDNLNFQLSVVPGEFEETCKFCTKRTTEINSEPGSVSTKDLNFEVKQNAGTQEPSCSICILKSNNKRKNCHGSKRETDFLRPASRISDKSNNSNISGNSDTKKKSKKEFTLETDPGILSRRQKQIEYGKNTTGYQRYKKMVPRDQRTKQDPQTPPKCSKYSRRAWDGLIKSWRRKLHDWDPHKTGESDDEILSVVSTSSFPTISDDSENLYETVSDLAEEEQTFAVERGSNGISINKDADSLQTKET
ncbi:Histone RNA hairpin-binding protein [Gryllus bimaculatus]|nr:Histone RNA hairpin-binding protein [Gryllus bimaculatus]